MFGLCGKTALKPVEYEFLLNSYSTLSGGPRGGGMAKKPVYEVELDDSDNDVGVDEIYAKYMEDISEIFARAYDEVGNKVQALVDDLTITPDD